MTVRLRLHRQALLDTSLVAAIGNELRDSIRAAQGSGAVHRHTPVGAGQVRPGPLRVRDAQEATRAETLRARHRTGPLRQL
ncbi:hypothetical protein ACFYXM_07735 [Streptomyces sp. NPDC002476]|uniref:hypothetical protein n=1 Tax=Streptomyces sp. NPDC002476 TaxID=3364648 RepID=UPI003678BF37